MLEHQELRLYQVNLHKHKERTHGVFNDPIMKDYTALLLQEQFWCNYSNSSPLHPSWTLYEPTAKSTQGQPRAAIYINNSALAPTQITQLDIPCSDAVAIHIDRKSDCNSKHESILIINIYNPQEASIIFEVCKHLASRIDTEIVIFAGDFNAHHPLWNPHYYLIHDAIGDELVEAAASLGLSLLTPPRTVTFPQARTAIDLAWGNSVAVSRLLKCKLAMDKDFGSDHLPIETVIAAPSDTTLSELEQRPPYDFSKTDWEEFSKTLSIHLPSLTEI